MQQHHVKPASKLHGMWRKDLNSSDISSFSQAMDAMKLSNMQKKAALALMDRLHLAVDEDQTATLRFITKIPFFNIVETYKLGRETRMQRRDLRGGQQRAIAHEISENRMHVEIVWDGECGGRVKERFLLNESTGRLEVEGTMEMNHGEKVKVYQVYTRDQ